MAEKEQVIKGKSISYTGIFNVHEIYDIIESFLDHKDYDKQDVTHDVKHTKNGLQTFVLLNPEKKFTDSEATELEISFILSNVNDVELTLNGKKEKMQQGTVIIDIEGYLYFGKDKQWAKKKNAFLHALTLFASYFVFKAELDNVRNEIKMDVNELYETLTTYFNGQAFLKY